MKILKLLNKKNFLILFFLFFTSIANAEEKPVDIWNIDKKEIEEKNTTLSLIHISEPTRRI